MLPPGLQDRYVHCLREGHGRFSAAAEINQPLHVIYQTAHQSPLFKQRCLEAEQVALDLVEKGLMDMARQGNLSAAKFVLTNRRPRQWSEALLPHTSTQIQINVASTARQLAENPEASSLALQALTVVSHPLPPQQSSTLLPPVLRNQELSPTQTPAPTVIDVKVDDVPS